MKKKTLVPLIVFLLGICLVSLVVYKTDTHEKEQSRTTAQLNVTTYGERIKNEITNGIEITDVLKQLLISENGEINQFDTIAENIMSDSVESIQLAPAGIVTDIYPAEGNETGKIDLIHDKDRGEISIYARDHHTIVTQGPFELKQGGYGIAVRNPVYLKDENIPELLDAGKYDFIVDAIDTISPKCFLIYEAMKRRIRIVSSMGAGAKSDITQVRFADLWDTYHCGLSKAVRKRLQKMGMKRKLPVVFSTEQADPKAVLLTDDEQNKKSTCGTVSYMPAVFGCYLAEYVIKRL